MNDLVLLESPALRQQLCTDSNLEILDKVGQLVFIEGTAFTTTEGLAQFFEESVMTIAKAVQRYDAELKSDGYMVLSAKDFRERHNVFLKSKARWIALFPRRAVLRLAMVLRDSPIAKQIRTYLLDREEVSRDLGLKHVTRMICILVAEIYKDRERISALEKGASLTDETKKPETLKEIAQKIKSLRHMLEKQNIKKKDFAQLFPKDLFFEIQADIRKIISLVWKGKA